MSANQQLQVHGKGVSSCSRRYYVPDCYGLLVGAVTLVICGICCWWRGIPVPIIQDEFSYLFAGETFAAGRLSNPVLPQWEYFEQIHVLMHPLYVSKYPPLQGLFLAVGTLLDLPIVGVWLNAMLAAIAVYWMIAAVVPRSLAASFAVIVMMQPLLLSWTQCYWGGLAGMLGGCLAVGGLLRTISGEHVIRGSLAVCLCGFFLLGISRPFEGTVLGLALGTALLGVDVQVSQRLARVVWCNRGMIFLFLISFVAWTGWYNRATTGNYAGAPYLLYELTYLPSPPFLWQSERSVPVSSNPTIARFCFGWSLDLYRSERTWVGYWAMLGERLLLLKREFVREIALLIPCGVAYWIGKLDLVTRWMILTLCFCGISCFVTTWFNLHYLAPFLPLVLVLSGKGLVALQARCPWSAGLILLVSGVAMVRWVSSPLPEAVAIMQRRASIEQQLIRSGGKHLIVVKDSESLNPNTDWVYNHPTIHSAPVVWVRDRGIVGEVCALFPDRSVWTVLPATAATLEEVACLK